ncbi:hypothetical protein [Proteus phage RP7]|nr:hypothetical protein [Proteus phage RP7]
MKIGVWVRVPLLPPLLLTMLIKKIKIVFANLSIS